MATPTRNFGFNQSGWSDALANLQRSVHTLQSHRSEALVTISILVSVIFHLHGAEGFLGYFYVSVELEPLRKFLDLERVLASTDRTSLWDARRGYLKSLLVVGGSSSEEVEAIS